jgi:hypothetical protein
MLELERDRRTQAEKNNHIIKCLRIGRFITTTSVMNKKISTNKKENKEKKAR